MRAKNKLLFLDMSSRKNKKFNLTENIGKFMEEFGINAESLAQ